MIKNLLLAIVTVFGGTAAFAVVFNLASLLVSFADYKKEMWRLNIELAKKTLGEMNK